MVWWSVGRADARPDGMLIRLKAQAIAKSLRFLTQLAVLAATAIEGRSCCAGIAARLAWNAGARAGQGPPTSFRNFFAAEFAMRFAFALRHAGPRELYRVGDRVVDLILHSTVACPTTCHFPKLSPAST